MKIEYKQVPELLKTFRGFWPSNYHIKFKWEPIMVQVGDNSLDVRRVNVITVKVNDTDKGGEAEEHWTLEYAYTLLKSTKEMELCINRWHLAFKNVKRISTLNIEGQRVDSSTLN